MDISDLPQGIIPNAAYKILCEAIEVLVGDEFARSSRFESLCQAIHGMTDAANRDGYEEGVQETKQQCSQAADILGLRDEWQRIDKTSHEM